MSGRIFQNVVLQLKENTDRTVGVIDGEGIVIACSELSMADLGVFTLAGKYAPCCQRHISTQASIANYECARAWHDQGARRVILARELSLDEIREIRAKTPASLEIECFVHASLVGKTSKAAPPSGSSAPDARPLYRRQRYPAAATDP